MWLFTQHGFYSIVQKDDGFLHIRARSRVDLENLLRVAGLRLTIHEWPRAEYRYRLLADLESLLEIMVHLTTSIDYPGFVEQIARRPDQRDRIALYGEVGTTMAARLKAQEA